MCLAVPGKILSIEGDHARIEYTGSVVREANVSLVPAKVGAYVIVHAGFAIQLLNEEEAAETLAVWDEFLESSASDGSGA